jgi:hypothetical protein
MIVKQCPCKAISTGLFKQSRESVNKNFAVTIIEENISSLNAPYNHML